MAILHLMVGLPCAGKTTHARELEQRYAALRLTPDEWHQRLFGDDVEDSAHDARHAAIEGLLWGIAERALILGVDVIRDFGFWSRIECEDYRARAQRIGAGSVIHYLDVAEHVLFERLAIRNAGCPAGTAWIPEAHLRRWLPLFEPPTEEERQPRS